MLGPEKSKELNADISTLEVGDLNIQTYKKMMVLKALKFFQELEEIGGVSAFLGAKERSEAQPLARQTQPFSGAARTDGSSDFLAAVDGKDVKAVLCVIDGHMDDLRAMNGRAYNAIMRRINEI